MLSLLEEVSVALETSLCGKSSVFCGQTIERSGMLCVNTVSAHWPSSLAVRPESGFGISHMSATGYFQNVSWAEQILQGTYFVNFPLYPYLTESAAKRK